MTRVMNGPWGNDVFIPLDQVIWRQGHAGKGWTMLLEFCRMVVSIFAAGLGNRPLAKLQPGDGF